MMITAELLVVLAILVEGIVNVFVNIYIDDPTLVWYKRVQWKLIASIAVGVLIAFTTQANIFTTLEIPIQSPQIAYILTGLLISRGSNYIYELVTGVRTARQVSETKVNNLPQG